MASTKQMQQRAREARKQAKNTRDHLQLERDLVQQATPANREIYQRMLANPLFRVEGTAQSEDGKYQFAVIMPDMTRTDTAEDETYTQHLTIYKDALGGVESQSFNLQSYLEQCSVRSFEQQGGPRPFEPFQGGAYRLGFLMRDDGDRCTISPLMDHDWDPATYEFQPAYGDAVVLEQLPATIARSVLTAIPFSGFNPGREQMMQRVFEQSWMALTPVSQANWMSAYSSIYDFKLFLECSGQLISQQQLGRLHKALD